MRTTLNIEEDALALIKRYAEERGVSLGQATSDLVHRGAESLPRFQTKNGWVLLELPEGRGPFDEGTVKKLEEADEEEEYRGALSPRR